MDLGGNAYRTRHIDFSPYLPTEGHRPILPGKSRRTAPRPELAPKCRATGAPLCLGHRAGSAAAPWNGKGLLPPAQPPSAIGTAAHYVSSRVW